MPKATLSSTTKDRNVEHIRAIREALLASCKRPDPLPLRRVPSPKD